MERSTGGWVVSCLFVALFLAIFAFATLARPALAANIAVTTKADENNSDGDCSLREAIIAANTDAPRDACAAGFGADTIVLPPGTHKVYVGGANEDAAATGDLDVTGYTIIMGAGARETKVLAASGFDDRVFDVWENAAIFDLTISGGNPVGNQGYKRSGGGIRNRADDLTLSEVVVDGNTAYAGGGIDHQGGNLNIHKSTLSNNTADGEPVDSAGVGGGGALLHTGGELTITNSTIANNNAALEGGAIDNLNDAGATITNSTIAGNTASSGGAIGNAGLGLALENTIVANNTDTAPGTGTDNCDGSATSLGTNLEDLDTCGFGQPKDRTNTDPNLGALADNGGPTDTMALPAGSQAIDAASGVTCPATDQRGEARPADGDGNGTPTCDIGAFEREVPPDIIAPTVTRVVPEEDATEVGRSKVIKATFSEAMEESSINTDTFELYEAGAATPVEATVSYDAAKKKAFLDPVDKLARGARYEAIVTNNAEDEAGNHLDQAPGIAGNQRKRWFFTTRN